MVIVLLEVVWVSTTAPLWLEVGALLTDKVSVLPLIEALSQGGAEVTE